MAFEFLLKVILTLELVIAVGVELAQILRLPEVYDVLWDASLVLVVDTVHFEFTRGALLAIRVYE